MRNSFQICSYKQQHQIFVQHASQQIAVLETQKLALQAQAPPQTSQPPPSAQPVPSQDPVQLGMLPGDCDGLSNNQLNGSYNRADNRMGNVPPPLMSQNIAMPRSGMNLNYISSQPQTQRMNFPSDNSFAVSIDVRSTHTHFVFLLSIVSDI